MISPSVRRGSIGAVVGSAWIAGLFVAEPLVGAFGLVGLAEELILRSPGWLSTAAIGLFGFSAKPAVVVGIAVGIVGATAVGFALWPPGVPHAKRLALAGAAVVTAFLFLVAGAGLSPGFVVGLVVAVATPFLAGWSLWEVRSPPSRRRFLRRLGTVGAAGVVSLAGLRVVFDRLGGPRESPRVRERLDRPPSTDVGDTAFDFAGMPAAVTAPEDHYVVDITVRPPIIDPERWRLDIEGAVLEPYFLSYDELLDHEASVEQIATMICISNRVGGPLIGTARWTGIQLSDLVGAAGPTDRAVNVVTHAADGYSEAIPIDLVEREDIIVAYAMGDRTLATEHGFPARLIIPGRYGMKMTKWIERIEVSENEHVAYWQARGWDEEAIVNTMSYVRGAERIDGRVVVGGVAFGGLETGVEAITGVEVSVDGGETWHAAEVERQPDVHAWRRWRYVFDAPDASEFEVVVRAIERDGTVQTAEETGPVPSGATGWHRETIQV